jgi:hypothetical protein
MARTFTAGERTNIALGLADQDIYATLELKDPDGDWIDVTAFASKSWLVNLSLEETVDGNCQTLSGTLIRSLDVTNSLAPLLTASLRNRDNGAAYAPFLDVARSWRAKCAVVARGVAVVAGDWKEIGAGTYDLIAVNDPNPIIEITGRDWGATLLDAQILTPKVYSQDSDVAMETAIQSLMDDTLGVAAITLYTPTSPSFVLNRWEQQPMSLMQAVNDVAALAGMVVRYRYDASNVNRLTLSAPDRTASAGDEVWTLDANEYWHIDKWALDLSGIRNKIVVNYWDTATNAGATVTASDATSITRYGGPHGIARILSIDLSEDTKIVTAAKAQDLADLILSDLDAPVMELQLATPGFWIAQLGDYGKFLANTVQFDTAQYGGVTSIRHVFEQGTMMTTLGIRGQPAGRYRSWFPTDPVKSFGDLCRIQNFRELTRASTTITVQWVNEGNSEGIASEIWLWYVVKTQPVASDPWPSMTSAPTVRLTPATTSYSFDVPNQDTLLYGIIVPIGRRSIAGVPWRFTLQPSTATRLQQRARVLTTTPQSAVYRVEVANPIAGGDVTITYVADVLTVSPASGQVISGASVPTTLDGTAYVDFTVTRPVPGANGRVTFTAASTDRISDVDAVDVPALDGIPQGTVAISAAGACTLTLDGSAWVASYKYAESTSAYPTDATARAGTTSNGRQVSITLGSTLAVSESVYVTVLPYSVTAAGGVEGASVRFRATRFDLTATKTTYYAALTFVPDQGSTDLASFVGGYIEYTATSVPTTATFVANLAIAAGVTITQFAGELYSGDHASGDGIAQLDLHRTDATGVATSVASLLHNDGTGWASKSASVSELASAVRRYKVQLELSALVAAFDNQRCAGYSITHTMPSVVNSL